MTVKIGNELFLFLLVNCAVFAPFAGFTLAEIGGVLSLSLLMFRALDLSPVWRAKAWVARLHSAKSDVPYGAALGLAGLVALKDTAWTASIIWSARKLQPSRPPRFGMALGSGQQTQRI